MGATCSPYPPQPGDAMNAFCLADVFNLDLWPRGRPPNLSDVERGLWDLVDEATSAVPSARDVTVRLYGGWHRETVDARVDMRHMMDRAIANIPKRYGVQRVRVQLADHPIWDPAASPLLRSLRVSRPPRVDVRLTPADSCIDPSACTFNALRSWCGGKCPERGCSVKLQDIAERTRQKMVDTLLTADAMAIIQDRLAQAVVLASDDSDMLPALLALSASDLKLTHLRRDVAAGSVAAYDPLFNEAGTHIRTW